MREGGAARDARREKEETGASSRFHLVGSITFGEKTDAATLGDRLRNRYVLALNTSSRPDERYGQRPVSDG